MTCCSIKPGFRCYPSVCPVRVYSSSNTLQFKESTRNSKDLWGKTKTLDYLSDLMVIRAPKLEAINSQATISLMKQAKWWEDSPEPNMIDVNSGQELVDHLLNAGDRLVIVDFYSPGCGGCKALHPKICQLAGLNQKAIFLKVNYDQHKKMCHALHVHVLPFFRFYRGAEGRLCSFSCTNATIKKFKDALSKHGTERCSLAPAKGLDESELLALASVEEIKRDEERFESNVVVAHNKGDGKPAIFA